MDRCARKLPLLSSAWFGVFFPGQVRHLNALETRQQRGDEPLILVVDDFRGGDRQRAEKMAAIVIHAKVERVAGKINARLRVLAVSLRAEQVEFSRLQLDDKRFDACLTSGKFRSAVQSDQQDGAVAGVNGTPAFYINGISLSGNQPASAFYKIIDEQLAALSPKQPKH